MERRVTFWLSAALGRKSLFILAKNFKSCKEVRHCKLENASLVETLLRERVISIRSIDVKSGTLSSNIVMYGTLVIPFLILVANSTSKTSWWHRSTYSF